MPAMVEKCTVFAVIPSAASGLVAALLVSGTLEYIERKAGGSRQAEGNGMRLRVIACFSPILVSLTQH